MIPTVRFAEGVTLTRPPAPAGVRILAALDACAQLLKHDITITCADGGHGPNDPHTLGEAYDVRVTDLTLDQINDLCHALDTLLDTFFTTLYETPPGFSTPAVLDEWLYVNPDASGPHLHIQRKKGTVYPPQPIVARHASES